MLKIKHSVMGGKYEIILFGITIFKRIREGLD